jgi:hypothetical protein
LKAERWTLIRALFSPHDHFLSPFFRLTNRLRWFLADIMSKNNLDHGDSHQLASALKVQLNHSGFILAPFLLSMFVSRIDCGGFMQTSCMNAARTLGIKWIAGTD